MDCRASPDVLEKRKSVASAGNRTLDGRPARSIIAMLMVEILKAFIQARIMTAIWAIIISSTCSSTPRGTSEGGRVAELCTERFGETAVEDHCLASSDEPREGVWWRAVVC